MIDKARYISALYAVTHLRAPDKKGFEFWMQQDDRVLMVDAFVAQPVYHSLYGGLDDRQFIQALYQQVLDDQGEDAGVAFWLAALENGATRAQLVAGFLQAALSYQGASDLGLARQAVIEKKADKGLWYMDSEQAIQDYLISYQQWVDVQKQHQQLDLLFDPLQLEQHKMAVHMASHPYLPPYFEITDRNLQVVFDAHDVSLRVAQARLDDLADQYPSVVLLHKTLDRYQLNLKQTQDALRMAQAEMQKVAVLNGLSMQWVAAEYRPAGLVLQLSVADEIWQIGVGRSSTLPDQMAHLKGAEDWFSALQDLYKKHQLQNSSWVQGQSALQKIATALKWDSDEQNPWAGSITEGSRWITPSGQMTVDLLEKIDDQLRADKRLMDYAYTIQERQKTQAALDEIELALDHYQESFALQQKLQALSLQMTLVWDELHEKTLPLQDVGVQVMIPEGTEVWGNTPNKEALPDLFIYAGQDLDIHTLGQPSVFYLGQGFVPVYLPAGQSYAGGVVSELEVFLQQVGSDTHLYIEKEPFAGHLSVALESNLDLARVVLSGVSTQDILIENGFLYFA